MQATASGRLGLAGESLALSTVLLWMMLVCGLLLMPFLFTAYPPLIDLPQHLSQMYLLEQALGDAAGIYEVNWFAPGNLIYLLLAVLELFLPPQWSGRVLVMLIVCCWAGAAFYIAWVRQRSLEGAIIASLFVYNLTFYWGFLNFQIGWPIFAVFVLHILKPFGWRNWAVSFLLLLLLYASHSFWFLLGAVVMGMYACREWPDIRKLVWRCSVAIPLGLVSVTWFFSIAAERGAGADIAAHWDNSLLERLLPPEILNASLGGTHGLGEPIVAGAALLWILLGLVTNYGQLRERIDWPLLSLAAIFIGIVLVAPDTYMNSIFFSRRFMPLAAILLLLALPGPAAKAWIRKLFALVILLIFTAGTSLSWYFYNQAELSGFQAALDNIPERQRVMGLDYIKFSSFMKGRMFIQLFAYAQAFKGADINFSFAEHNSSIVKYRELRDRQWTPGLEWYPERVKPQDLQYFDYLLVNAEDVTHEQFAGLAYLQPVTVEGRWRLYKTGVVPEGGDN